MNDVNKINLDGMSELFANTNNHHEANQVGVSKALWRDYVIKHVDLHQHIRSELLLPMLALDLNMLLDKKMLRSYNNFIRTSIVGRLIYDCLIDESARQATIDKIILIDRAKCAPSELWRIEIEYETFCTLFGGQEDRSYSMISLINAIVRNDKNNLSFDRDGWLTK